MICFSEFPQPFY